MSDEPNGTDGKGAAEMTAINAQQAPQPVGAGPRRGFAVAGIASG